MSKKVLILLFSVIILVAVVLRFWQLGNVPVSPDWDEAALGYNAYSILHTGRDEYGKFLPVVLKSFGDYKPALYSYLVIPSIMAFNLTVFAVRFPSAVFGILTVIAVFFLVRELFNGYKHRDELSLLSAFLLAISPWHIQFSRVAFESNVGLALNVFAALFFVLGLRKRLFLILSSVPGALAIYVYQSEKVFTPLLFLLLIAVFYKDFFKIPKKYLLGFLISGLILVLPMVAYITGDSNSLLRAKGTSIFAQQTDLLRHSIVNLEQDKRNNDVIGLLVDNRRVVYLTAIIGGYLSHYDLNWLFIKGDIGRHHAPQMGLLYLWELPFLLIGIYSLIFGDFNKKTKLLFFGWFLLAPIPASITTGVPHAVRTLNFLPTFQLFVAIGIIGSLIFVSRIKYQILNVKVWKLFVIFYLLFAIFNFTYYLNQYFVQQNYFNSQDWQYGYQQAVKDVSSIKSQSKVVVSNSGTMDQSYIFFLFYLKSNPKNYQENTIYDNDIRRFDNFEFRKINWEKDSKLKNVTFVGSAQDFPGDVRTIDIIHYLNGEEAMKIVKN